MHSSSPVALLRRIMVAALVAGTSSPIVAAAQPTITVRDTVIAESGNLGSWTMVRIKIRLSAPSSQTVTVVAEPTGVTAEKGSVCGATADFFGPVRTVTFPPNNIEQFYDLSVCGDNLVEGSETLKLTLSNPVNAVLGAAAIITMADNDSPAPSRVYISGVVPPTAFSERVPSDLNPIYTIRLNPAATTVVEVKYEFVDETATRGSSCSGNADYVGAPNTLIFAPGETEKTVTVPICNDTRVDEPSETFLLKLTSAVGAVLGSSTTISGNLPNEVNTSRRGQILDDDKPSVTVSGAGLETNNGQTTIPVTFTLNQARSEPLRIEYSTVLNSVVTFRATSGTACVGSADFIAIPPTTVTFMPGEVTKTINLTVCGDTAIERDETLQLQVASTNGPALSSSISGAVKITNDDMPRVSVADASVSAGTSDTPVDLEITVVLAPKPGEPATVSYSTANGSLSGGVVCGGRGSAGYVATSGTLSFDGASSDVPGGDVPGNFVTDWTQTRKFTVRVCNRNTPSAQAVKILLSNATNAVISGGGGWIRIVSP